MSSKSTDLLQALLREKLKRQKARFWPQGEKAANKLRDKQNRWQRFNRYGWDKKQG